MNPLIIVLVVVVVTSAVVGLAAFVFRDTGANRASDRLDTLVGKRAKESASDLLLKQSHRESDKKTLLDLITPNILSLQKIFEQADCHIKASTLFGVGLGLAVIFMSLSWLATKSIWAAPFVGLLVFPLPFLWLLNKRRVRLKSFAGQLPDGLELVARALRAGHSLGAGMHVVAEEMPSPIADEFSRVYEEQNLGIALEDAMRQMCERVPNLDLRFFVTSVAIQRQTGGDLSEILDKIGYVIRERYRILGQVKALTAEGRLSGVVLIALPFVLFLVMLHIKPDYVATLWTHPLGKQMSIIGLIMQVLGAVVIKKIVDIKV
ncbi:MAG TPA: type II secretion system F family protein [Gemmataceae bacterium]|nr:type II secretion system F family protein [Gemmataceae bacterium]